eukprot:TRINITY_DN778052_c0_g1_i1.p1 TRINITY_DN778052_c0_g1~~TRINITY_DN778052_c0_g1_i1.p1  ORF type:complete len:106 (-),score=20.09 TRINITY_DN778052_c0_g1_i1:75-392(-)
MSMQKKKKDDKDLNFGPEQSLVTDMGEEMENFAWSTTKHALKDWTAKDFEQYDIAKQIKNDFEEKYGGAWHVVVGREFGSHVSYETDHLTFFSIGELRFLIYKHG